MPSITEVWLHKVTHEPENCLMVRYIIVISLCLSEGFHICNLCCTCTLHVHAAHEDLWQCTMKLLLQLATVCTSKSVVLINL